MWMIETTFRPLEQQWGSTDPHLITRSVSMELAMPTLEPLITEWGEVLPSPVWSLEDYNILLALCRDPSLFHGKAPVPLKDLLRITINPALGCWELPVYDDPKPRARYGVVSAVEYGAKKELAHRFMYRQLVGPIPEEHFLDHRCLNKACCWPRHLEPVTHAENNRRGRQDKRHRTQPQLWQPEGTISL